MLNQKNELVDTLKSAICTVEFQKKDGSLRKMRCTLKESFLPPPVDKTQKKQSDHTVSVWSIDDNGWRSFIVDNVKKISLEQCDGINE